MQSGVPRILVEGDWMLDTWLNVESGGFAQEAPITKWKVRSIRDMDGGAGNVTANLLALGADVVYPSQEWARPQKFRLVEDGRVVTRFDIDQTIQPRSNIEWDTSLDGIVLSDYGKGRFIPTPRVLNTCAIFCDTRDPAPWLDNVDANWYFFPNTTEFEESKHAYTAALARQAKVVITKGKAGAKVLFPDYSNISFASPDPCGEPVSVCGAGDVVVAVVAYLVTAGKPLDVAVAEAMRLAARCVRRPYTCCVTPEDLNAN